jgi:cation-transporting ATPase E
MSGDSPLTVGTVASQVGVPGADEPVDARHLLQDLDALRRILQERSVFGRVIPRQKQAMVKALQAGDTRWP